MTREEEAMGFMTRRKLRELSNWNEWEEGILSSFKYPAFQIAWKELPSSEAMYSEFKRYILENVKFE